MRIVLASIVASAAACAAPRPHYHFVMPSVPAGGAGTCDPAGDSAAACPRVAVTGQVTRPGLIRYDARLTIVGAIVACGGFTELARQSQVVVTRVVNGAPHRYHASIDMIINGDQPDFALRADDVVHVPQGD